MAASLPLASATEPQLACELTGVTKSFGAVKAVDDVSLDVAAGSLTCLIGPNGAGKSTLLGCISGLHFIDSGIVRIDGQDVTRWPPHRRARHGLATVFQTTRPLAELDVLDNAAVGAHVRSRTGHDPVQVHGIEQSLPGVFPDVAIGHAVDDSAKQRVAGIRVQKCGAGFELQRLGDQVVGDGVEAREVSGAQDSRRQVLDQSAGVREQVPDRDQSARGFPLGIAVGSGGPDFGSKPDSGLVQRYLAVIDERHDDGRGDRLSH